MSFINITKHHQQCDTDKIKSKIKTALWSNIQSVIIQDKDACYLSDITGNDIRFNINTFVEALNRSTTIDVTKANQSKDVYLVRVQIHPTKLRDGFLDLLSNKFQSLMRKRTPNGEAPLSFLNEIATSTETALAGFTFDPKRNQATYPRFTRTSHRSQNRWLDSIIIKSAQHMNQSIFFQEY